MIVTSPPSELDSGVNELIDGAGMKVNKVAEVAVPPGVVIEIGPVVVKGTSAAIEVSLITVKFVATSLNVTSVVSVKFVPVRITTSPSAPVSE